MTGLPLLFFMLFLAIAHSSYVHAFEPWLCEDMWSTAGETADNLGEPVYFVIVDLRDRVTALEKIVAAQGEEIFAMNTRYPREMFAKDAAAISQLQTEMSKLRALVEIMS